MSIVQVQRIVRHFSVAFTLIVLLLIAFGHLAETRARASVVGETVSPQTGSGSVSNQETVTETTGSATISPVTGTITSTVLSSVTVPVTKAIVPLSSSLLVTPTAQVILPPVEPLDVKGNIIIAGSSTVYPLAQSVYRRFILDGYGDEIQINRVGTGLGFRLFCQERQADMVIASRRIGLDELDTCTANNLTPVEFQIATDALSIVVSSQNDFLNSVTEGELDAIFRAERWSDVNPIWPNELIVRYVPPPSSGTFDFFVSQVAEGNATALLNAPNMTQNIDFDSLAQDVANDPYAIGFMGYVYYNPYGEQEQLRTVAINNSTPSPESIDEGSYPMARPLFFYASLETLIKKPQVRDFANFFLTKVNTEIEEAGYFPTADAALERSRERLLEVIQGSIGVAGSATLSPLLQSSADRLGRLGYDGGVRIQDVRSGEGFRIFCQNWDSDLANSTRRMQIDEIISCTVSDRTPLRLRIGTDALAVVVHPDNAFAQDITQEELAALFSVERWSEVNPDWPDELIQRFIPNVGSGAFNLFAEKVYAGNIDPLLRAANTLQSRDDESLARGVANTLNGVAFLPYTVFRQESASLRALTIDQVAPNQESVEQGKYLLTRPLYVFSARSIIQQKPQIAALLNQLLLNLDEESRRLGYFPASELVQVESRAKLLDAMRVRE